MAAKEKRKLKLSNVWQEARALIWTHRSRLAVGLSLMLMNRLAGLVLPTTSKYLIDDVVGNQNPDLLPTLALAVGVATLIQASSAFGLAQVLGVAAQRAITEMRKVVQQHVMRLPVAYFDSTKTGILISRIMTDAEGIRNLVGTGLVQLSGGFVTSAIAMVVLFYLNWSLTLITLVVLAAFAGVMAYAFTYLRPVFRERSKIYAEVTGRLTESLAGVRIVKA
ncbi:MAG: ABC transporter ATP-binding protein, partial [Gemmatimonadetes bacterium]|nr:ABC transporter ATP-binding protein [Gemmatimonadota bacterium]